MIWAVCAALAGAAALTYAHLRPRGARAALRFPSLQHVAGTAARRRRSAPLEQVGSWALRLAVLAVALLGIWAARRGPPQAILLTDEIRDGAPGLEDTAAWLAFEGDTARFGGEDLAPAAIALRSCSDTRPACLLRAAARTGRPLVLKSAFPREWEEPLREANVSFQFVRVPPADALAGPAAGAPARPAVRLRGTTGAARLWAAAIESAAAGSKAALEIADDGPPPPGWKGVIATSGPSPAVPWRPAVEVIPARGIALEDPLELAAGVPALPLGASLRFAGDPRFHSHFAGLVAERDGTIALAATPSELGRWAHEGRLVPLARAVLALASPAPLRVKSPPPGGKAPWTDGAGLPAGVGVVDVAPGTYLRKSGDVLLDLARPPALPGPALDDAALERLGGTPWKSPSGGPARATWLLGLALLLWLVASVPLRSRSLLPGLVTAALLTLLVADVSRPRTVEPGLVAEAAPELLPALSAIPRVCTAAACESLGLATPAGAPKEGATALVFDALQPRIDLLEVRVPGEVPLGSAAEVWATVRVRRAAGRTIEVQARPLGAAGARARVGVSSGDETSAVRLPVVPLAPGLLLVAVEAGLEGEPASDGRLVVLGTRQEPARRLLLSATPSWEARSAAEALEALGERPATESTRLATQAVFTRGASRRSPAALLGDAAALRAYDTLVLAGFRAADLPAAAVAGLRHFLEQGGAVLVLGNDGPPAALGWPESGDGDLSLHERLTGTFGGVEAFRFRGYAPGTDVDPPLGAEILGEVELEGGAPRPWIVGRAVGRGRLAQVTAPDLFRVSPPAGRGPAYRGLLARILAWAEAAPGRPGPALEPGWQGVRMPDGSLEGLPSGADPATLVTAPRARLRAALERRHQPFLEIDGAGGLAAAWGRVPRPSPVREQHKLRHDDLVFALLSASIGLEALLRRSRAGQGNATGTR